MLDLGVIIITWNIRNLIGDALGSLLADLETNNDLNSQVIVVDSASSDGTPEIIREQFPQVQLITCEENIGFVRGNNLGLRELGFDTTTRAEALPKAVYLLNPDTITQPGATHTLYNVLMNTLHAGLVGAQLSYEDGSFQHGAFAFPDLRQLWVEFFPTPGRLHESRFNGRYPPALYRTGRPFPVDFTLGATMMLRGEVVQQIGLMDDQYFMYCEEVDWAWRVHNAGWQVYCVPQAHVTHLSGKSTSQVRPQSIVRLWNSRLLLFHKHYPAWKRQIARRMVITGMQRKIQQAQDDPASDNTEHANIIAAYQRVQQIYREDRPISRRDPYQP